MGDLEVVRWNIEPLTRSRRGVDERIALALPSLTRRLMIRATRESAGSRLRRAVLTRAVQVAVAANNRGLLIRQENFYEWADALAALSELQSER